MGASLFVYLAGSFWMVRVKRQEKEEGLFGERQGTPERKSRGTKVRTRCKGRTPDEEVEAQLTAALPHIVKANVEKAKAGSLAHTKWLWDKSENTLRIRDGAEAAKARASLAELLMEQLKEQG